MKCGNEEYGKKQYARSAQPRQIHMKRKLIKLFEKADILCSSGENRKMNPSFLWNIIDRPKSEGTCRDKEKEKVIQSDLELALHSRLCKGGEAEEYNDFDLPSDEDDDDLYPT